MRIEKEQKNDLYEVLQNPQQVSNAGAYEIIKKRSSTLGLGLEVRVRINVWISDIVIVDPLQPNTLLHTMALQRQ
jgi:CRISPR/Cas system-associated endonuclease Cas3-HD